MSDDDTIYVTARAAAEVVASPAPIPVVQVSPTPSAGSIQISGIPGPPGPPGPDEVWIGSTPPTDTAIELWYDTSGVLYARVADAWVAIAGAPAAAYTHVQSAPSMTWVIDHPFDFNPNVTIVDSSDRQVEGDIAYSLGQVVATFSAAFGGKAYLS